MVIIMAFKLLRIDSDEPCKIELPCGVHLIGRGKFLDCEDKRVSRNHGQLEVLSDTVAIKALHQNPCFVTKKGNKEVHIVKQNCTMNIDNGDKFGLLPDTYWYELLRYTTAVDALPQNEDISSTATEQIESAPDTEPMEIGDVLRNQPNVSDSELNNTVKDGIGSPSLLSENQIPTENPSTPKRRLSNEQPKPEQQSSPPKRSHSPQDESVVKKIKTEPEIKQEPEVKTEPVDVGAGPSKDRAVSPSLNNNDAGSKSPPQPQNPLLRERCMYGATCYRKNPQHKTQFSHPADPDWGTEAQAVCPWGGGCRRTDPRHWRDHSHPPGVQRPNAQQQGRNFQPNPGNKKRRPKPKKNSDSDEDEDSPAVNNIVQGKRIRKTINRPNNWSGSESENEDPFQTDESDEWQPSNDVTDSQLYSQDYSQI